jgi:Flp pilus assembly protein TadG
MRTWRRLERCERGAAAVEFALIALALILVSVGVIEFGRGLLLRNELSFAADHGARKVLLDPTVEDSALQDAIRSALIQAQSELLVVTLGTETADGAQYRTIFLSYPLMLLIPGFSGETISLSLSRRVPL